MFFHTCPQYGACSELSSPADYEKYQASDLDEEEILNHDDIEPMQIPEDGPHLGQVGVTHIKNSSQQHTHQTRDSTCLCPRCPSVCLLSELVKVNYGCGLLRCVVIAGNQLGW